MSFKTRINIRKAFQHWREWRGKAWIRMLRFVSVCTILEYHWFCYVSQNEDMLVL